MKDGIFVQIVGVEVKGDMRVGVCMHRKGWVDLVEVMVAQACISVCFIRNHNAARRVDLWGKLGRSLSRLPQMSVATPYTRSSR